MLDLFVDVPGLTDRVQAILPALSALVRGHAPGWLDKLRRNVALHAEAPGVSSLAKADAGSLRRAQKGRRLGSTTSAAAVAIAAVEDVPSGPLRAEAPVFIPGAGAWEPIEHGLICTCGAHVYSSISLGSFDDERFLVVPGAPHPGVPQGPLSGNSALGSQEEGVEAGAHLAHAALSEADAAQHIHEVEEQLRSWRRVGPSPRSFLLKRRRLDAHKDLEKAQAAWVPVGLPPDPGEGLLFGTGLGCSDIFSSRSGARSSWAASASSGPPISRSDGDLFDDMGGCQLDSGCSDGSFSDVGVDMLDF